MNLHDFFEWCYIQFTAFYLTYDDIHPFSDFPSISLFWLFTSTALTGLIFSLFPAGTDDNFDDEPEPRPYIYDDDDEFYEDFED